MDNKKNETLIYLEQLKRPFRMNEVIAEGVSRYMLYTLKEEGYLEQISRGLYRTKSSQPLSQPDLITVSMKVPKGVLCLISALDYHGLTTQVPHRVYIAIPKGARIPQLDYPPIQAHRFGQESYQAGIQRIPMDGIEVPIYSPEKTLADCFKFRNTLGMDVVLEALKIYQRNKEKDYSSILKFAKICRVEKIIRPYIEALL